MDTKTRLHEQAKMDREILHYVRSMAGMAPVTQDAIHGYLTHAARRVCTPDDVRDRLTYLVSAEYLNCKREWDGGEVVIYTVTATGMDMLDGRIPPREWNGGTK